MIKQNRWARRAGLPLLTFSINLLLASMIITGSYFLILGLNDAGYLEPLDSMRHRSNDPSSPNRGLPLPTGSRTFP